MNSDLFYHFASKKHLLRNMSSSASSSLATIGRESRKYYRPLSFIWHGDGVCNVFCKIEDQQYKLKCLFPCWWTKLTACSLTALSLHCLQKALDSFSKPVWINMAVEQQHLPIIWKMHSCFINRDVCLCKLLAPEFILKSFSSAHISVESD